MKRTRGTHVRCLPHLSTAPNACHVTAVYVMAGGDTEDILDGEIAIAELEEADIEEEIELVEITSIVPPGKLVGAHVSMSNGIARAVINAASIGKSRHDAFVGMEWFLPKCVLHAHFMLKDYVNRAASIGEH